MKNFNLFIRRQDSYFRTLRTHHWIKNILLLVPALAAHLPLNLEISWSLSLAFVSFSLMSSAVYIFNDINDIESDRQHKHKFSRPIAAGKLSLSNVKLVAIFLLAASLALATPLGGPYLFWALIYLALNLLYSGHLKKVQFVDVLCLTGFFCLRIMAGAAAAEVRASYWLIAFSLFFFFGLGSIKRYSSDIGSSKALYFPNGYKGLVVGGILASAIASLILGIYIYSPIAESLYTKPTYLLLGLLALIVWLSRLWSLTLNGKVDDDPVSYILRDRFSWLCLLVEVFAIGMAL